MLQVATEKSVDSIASRAVCRQPRNQAPNEPTRMRKQEKEKNGNIENIFCAQIMRFTFAQYDRDEIHLNEQERKKMHLLKTAKIVTFFFFKNNGLESHKAIDNKRNIVFYWLETVQLPAFITTDRKKNPIQHKNVLENCNSLHFLSLFLGHRKKQFSISE